MSERRSPEIAVVGSGLTAQETLKMVPDIFPDAAVTVYGNRSVGELTSVGPVEAVPSGQLPDFDYALLHTGADVSAELAPRFEEESGAATVDLSERFRQDPDKPLVVAPWNAETLTGLEKLVANPNCTTAIMLTALGPLHREYGIDRLILKSDQAVSGMGTEGWRDLRLQSAVELNRNINGPHYSLAFNVNPEIPGEAEKVGPETRKILGKPSVSVSARCTRVPVFRSHCIDVTVFTEAPADEAGVTALLTAAEGVEYWPRETPTPKQAARRNEVLVGPVWVDPANPRELRLWIVGDNLRRGAGLNALEIAAALEALRCRG